MANKIWINWENRKMLTDRDEYFEEIDKIYRQIVKNDEQLEAYLYYKFNSMANMFRILLNQEESIDNISLDFANWCYNYAKARVQKTFEEIELK